MLRARDVAREETKMIRMLVVVQTAVSLGVGEQVFLTGSTAELGAWSPDSIPMTRMDENRWEAPLRLRSDQPVEFKITRGTWSTEAVDANGRVPGNRLLEPQEEGQMVVNVTAWKDSVHEMTGPRITGNYVVLPRVASRFLKRERDVIVWLPPGYEELPEQRFPVLYMHDGRQVFDPTTSTWGQDWQVDEWAEEMIANGELEPFIVVAVDCTDARHEEYAPARQGKDYLRFLLEELKPLVDEGWRTDPERTSIAGSSMGGLISFYAGWKHPDVFEGAACLSPAFIREFGKASFQMVKDSGDKLPGIRLFLSCGGAGDLEARLLDGTLKMADLLKKTGFPGGRLMVRIEAQAEHNEAAWARMTPHWLRFLYGRDRSPKDQPE